MIRSLMRKRSWWVEVDSVSKANFIWTQLRIPTVINRLEVHEDCGWTTEIVFYE